MEKMVDHLKKRKEIPEIPRSQRYATRPNLASLFPDKLRKDEKRLRKRLVEAVERHGYRQSEIARQVGVHYSTISRWLHEYEDARRKT
jgi:DNA invertase Pin-like site-specific DNA recombinase